MQFIFFSLRKLADCLLRLFLEFSCCLEFEVKAANCCFSRTHSASAFYGHGTRRRPNSDRFRRLDSALLEDTQPLKATKRRKNKHKLASKMIFFNSRHHKYFIFKNFKTLVFGQNSFTLRWTKLNLRWKTVGLAQPCPAESVLVAFIADEKIAPAAELRAHFWIAENSVR